MRSRRWITVTTALTLLLAGLGTNAWAADSIAERIALKAARGLDNTVLGLVTDWPKTMYYEGRRHGVPYGATVGFVQGFLVGAARTGVGIYELATFPVPLPADYQPILSPQFSLQPGETQVAP